MATRFWVGGTGTWDASTTTNWSASTGGAGGASVPGSSDDVTINASSGAGTITVNTNFTISSLTSGAMGMTLEFGTNNNSPTFTTISGPAWSNTGTGTRTINLGSGTFTFNGTSNGNGGIDWGTTTGLTLGANTATFAFSGNTTTGRTMDFGSSTLSNLPSVTIAGNSSKGSWSILGSGAMTIPSLTISAPSIIVWSTNSITITTLVLSGGSVSSPIYITTNSVDSQRTIPLTNSATGAGLVFRAINPTTGTITGTNSIDLGRNGANVSFTAPSGGGGAVGVIGS